MSLDIRGTIIGSAQSNGGGISASDINTVVSFVVGAGAIEANRLTKPFMPLRYVNQGGMFTKAPIATNLATETLMKGSSYMRVASGALRWTGVAGGFLGMGASSYNYWMGVDPNYSGGKYTADMFFGAVGFAGVPGLMISTTYFVVTSPAFIQSSMDYQKQIQENRSNYGAGMYFMENGVLCFVGGTNITMADGSLKSIESIIIGDTVLTYDFENKRTIKTEVLRTDAPMHSNLVQISFSTEVKNTNTQDHPYFVKGKGWCSFSPEQSTERYSLSTSKLEVGDKCFVYQKGKLKKVKVTSIVRQEGMVKTYNLTGLKVGNSYFANGILVNNEDTSQNQKNKYYYVYISLCLFYYTICL
jgi:hypothetical protein